jgi:hypothetical protein
MMKMSLLYKKFIIQPNSMVNIGVLWAGLAPKQFLAAIAPKQFDLPLHGFFRQDFQAEIVPPAGANKLWIPEHGDASDEGRLSG